VGCRSKPALDDAATCGKMEGSLTGVEPSISFYILGLEFSPIRMLPPLPPIRLHITDSLLAIYPRVLILSVNPKVDFCKSCKQKD